MNILLVFNKLDYGGVSNYSLKINKAFNERNIFSKALYFKNERDGIASENKEIGFFEKVKEIRKNIKELNSDIIITNHGLETLLVKVSTLFLTRKVKVVSVIHIRSIMWMPSYNNKIKSLIFKILLRISFLACDKCIAVSDGLRKEVIEEGWINSNKIITIYNPLLEDNFDFKEKEICLDKEFIEIGMIGWISDIKNQIEAVEAISKLNDKKYRLHIIGGIGDQEYYLKLKQRVSDLHVESQIIFEGIKKDVFKEFETLDILILCSRTEALPTVIIEAMASGTPVIATDCKFGPRELLGGKYIYKQNDVDGLVKLIKIVASDTGIYNDLSKIGIIRAQGFKFSEIIKLYKTKVLNAF